MGGRIRYSYLLARRWEGEKGICICDVRGGRSHKLLVQVRSGLGGRTEYSEPNLSRSKVS